MLHQYVQMEYDLIEARLVTAATARALLNKLDAE